MRTIALITVLATNLVSASTYSSLNIKSVVLFDDRIIDLGKDVKDVKYHHGLIDSLELLNGEVVDRTDIIHLIPKRVIQNPVMRIGVDGGGT